jgi:periplasmic protein TonB
MPQRSLLFSSDVDVSRVLGQVLRAMGLEVEHCSEIFAAVEKLTTRSFDLIIVDLDDGVEAGFLLKTSRELKSSKQALAIALARSGMNTEETGVSLVLNKPLVADRARWTLLHSEPFLSHLKAWVPDSSAEKVSPATALSEPALKPAPPEEPAEAEVQPIVPLAETAGTKFRLTANLIHRSDAKRGWRRRPYDSDPVEHVKRAALKTSAGYLPLIRQSVLGAILILLAYVGIEPARSEAVVSSVAVMYQKAVQSTNDWLNAPARNPESAQMKPSLQAAADRAHAPKIRVTPVAAPTQPAEEIVPPPEPPESETVEAPQPVDVNASPQIPESLRASYDSAPVPNLPDRSGKPGTSLLSAVEPVVLPEDLAQKLLIEKVQPTYPEQAVKAGLQGPVVLEARISPEGTIQDLKLVRGYLILGQAASQAVRQWRYKPYLLNGQAVETQTYVTVNFKLP